MSDVMTQAIIGMPYELAMSDELSRLQFHSRAQELLADYAALEAELARLRAGQEPVAFYWQDVGYKNPNRHGPYFGWPTEAALRNVDGGAIPVPLYTTPQPSAVPDGWRELLQEVAEYAPPYGTIVAMTSQMALGSKARRMLAAAPSAPATAQHDDANRLDFMLIRNRKVVVERLPNDNFAVYVEEGFMGDKVYPSVSYSGEWASGSSEELEIKRKAIDAAIAAARKGEGE